MVSFTDHYNAIFIDRLSSKTKIGKDSWYFSDSLLCKPEVSSAIKTFFIKNTKNKKDHIPVQFFWKDQIFKTLGKRKYGFSCSECFWILKNLIIKWDYLWAKLFCCLLQSRILESLAGCRTMFLFAVFCKIGALERNVYWFHV